MFYPTNAIEELMSDVLVQETYNGIGTSADRPRYVTASNAKMGGMITDKRHIREIKGLQKSKVQHLLNGVKGTVPQNVIMHPEVAYSHKYGIVVLDGLDNALNKQVTFNGSWKP